MKAAKLLICSAIVLGSMVSGLAQTKSLSESERRTFYTLILRNHSFHEEVVEGEQSIEVKLIEGSVSADSLPSIDRVKFAFVSKDEVDRLRKTKNGIEYYEFGPLEHRRGRWYLFVSRELLSRCYGSGSGVEYEFRKVRGRWKFRRTSGNAWVAEGGKCPDLAIFP